jgi:pyrroline-5-carboxylate reductase
MIVQPTTANPILLFGCGNMGRAMLDGWLGGGASPGVFVVCDPYAKNLPEGVAHFANIKDATQKFGVAVLAIKPQMFADNAEEFGQLLAPDALVFSVLAGTRSAALEQKLPGRSIVRLMPNLAAAIGKSPLGLFTQNEVDRRGIEQLLAPLGQPFWLAVEDQMDAVTALAGSGPAFVYRFIEALGQAGTVLGLDANQSLALATAMVEGAAALAAKSDASPAELARRVTSPGGTTAAGLAVLDSDDALLTLIDATLRAARDRGVELSNSDD